MNRTNSWRWFLVVFLVAWALYETYPPTPRDLIDVFAKSAILTDSNLVEIIKNAKTIAANDRAREYYALVQAASTNDLARYFPSVVDEEMKYLPVEERNQRIVQELQKRAAGRIKLGLDLQGGVSFLMSLDTNQLANIADRRSALLQAVSVLRRRIDRLGVAEPIIQPVGEHRILVQLPGLSEAEKDAARRQLQRAAFLEFRLVHPESARLIREGIIEPGYEIKTLHGRHRQNQAPVQYLVEKKPAMGLTGSYVRRAIPDFDPNTGEPIVRLEFNSEGARIFADLTERYVGRQLAIILDGLLYSAPVIREPIRGGQAVISGDFTIEEAFELANVLQNPLQAPLHIEEERSVDPTLGQDSIRSGIQAAIWGLIAVSLFMIIYYLCAGLLADLAQLLNIILILGALCTMKATLTLPGIAGIVLTIGMAVDANVLIYERIREELKAGKSLRGAIDAGYSKAFGTILDANLTTLIAAIILVFQGTGPVKGFGVTLAVGICASMFTALVFTRLVFDLALSKGWLKRLRFQDWVGVPSIDFLKRGRVLFVLSWVLIAIGWVWGLKRGQDVLGIDFKGGDQLSVRFEQKIPTDQLRQALFKAGITDVRIQYQKPLAAAHELLTLVCRFGEGAKVEQILKESFPNANFERVSLEEVGPAITAEILSAAAVSLLLAILGILLYVAIRYEFSFAVGAVLALVHDSLMALGFVYLSNRQLNATVVAALLTVIGYSVNDTIVVFDRIRENLRLGLRGTFAQIINYSVNQTLSRTLLTSGTTLLTTICLLVFGGGAVNDFAFVLFVGIIVGTYSSIYIASLLVLWWHKGQRPKIAAEPTGAPVPGVEPKPAGV